MQSPSSQVVEQVIAAPTTFTNLLNESSSTQVEPAKRSGVVILVSAVYLIIFVIGVAGNLCNCLVIADTHNKYMKSATNYYLFSLSISDLLLLIFGIPHDLVDLWHPSSYLFSEFVCIARGWISEASTNASVLVIVAFTTERYLAICHPLRLRTFSHLSRSVRMIILIWLLASTSAFLVVRRIGLVTSTQVSSPDYSGHASQSIESTEIVLCTTVNQMESASDFELSVLVFFVIPMLVISVLYIRICCYLSHKTNIIMRSRRMQHHQQWSPTIKLDTTTNIEEEAVDEEEVELNSEPQGSHFSGISSISRVHMQLDSTLASSQVLEDGSQQLESCKRPEVDLKVPNSLATSREIEQHEAVLPSRASVQWCPLVASQLTSSLPSETGASSQGEPQRAQHPAFYSQDNGTASTRTTSSAGRRRGSGADKPALQSTVNTANMQSVIKMLVSVVVMFFVCWAPFHAQRLMAVYVTNPTPDQEFIYAFLNHISGISYYISAVANPFLYSLFSVKFRQAFRDTFGRLTGKT